MTGEQVSLRDHLYVIFGFVGLIWLIDRIETHRRLAELNHAHQQAVEERNTFLKKESYDQDQKAQREALLIATQQAQNDLGDVRAWQATVAGSKAGSDRIIIAAAGLVTLMISLATVLILIFN